MEALIDHDVEPIVVDLESIADGGLSISNDARTVRVEGRSVDFGQARAGWIRRVHRADWGLAVATGSLEALELGTWYSAFSWLIDSAKFNWITAPRALSLAESKLTQWTTAVELGIPHPRTLLTSSWEEVARSFDDEIVVKPLGSGQFLAGGQTHTVYAEAMMPNDDRLHALTLAPFIVQERLHASRHLRVVTVADRVWVGALNVERTAPVDWREVLVNHSAFEEVQDVPHLVQDGSVAIAKRLGLGYSSQDWVETKDGQATLLDVNPAGQWLFLPETIGAAVASAIAQQLVQLQ
ncbi:RimK family alpha-L-glutamate ligase [Microbacterium sp. 179-B 1A2 NHS]|uniref:ATP-grasp domain-containing protein n=1 Tax=Microbacterium sp. 179-B 1A2 NHS TaxID=3142383 RepID=UPI0039A0CFFE